MSSTSVIAADLPAAYLRDLVELVARWRISADQLFDGLPVKPAAIADPATRVPIAVCNAIIARAHALTGEPALAVYLGMQMRLSSHGFLGFAAMTSRTVGEAIELAVTFVRTRTSAIGLAHHVEGKLASLVFEARVPLGSPLHETAIIALAVGLKQIAEALTGRALPGTVEVTFAQPAWIQPGLPIVFGRPVDRLVFPASHLALPLVGADPIAAQLARAQCERELAAVVDAALPGRVRAAVAEALVAHRAPALEVVAKQLHVSSRTLKRRLADVDTDFTSIVADVRKQRAMLLLDDRALSIGEVATRLGYTELPNFTRAFKRWTGQTPAAYRARA